jgi:hypothetical protein
LCWSNIHAVLLSSVAFAIFGFCWNASTSARAASAGRMAALNASRRRRIARACNCDTRDSFTPISAPISFIVASP